MKIFLLCSNSLKKKDLAGIKIHLNHLQIVHETPNINLFPDHPIAKKKEKEKDRKEEEKKEKKGRKTRKEGKNRFIEIALT